MRVCFFNLDESSYTSFVGSETSHKKNFYFFIQLFHKVVSKCLKLERKGFK